MSTMPPSPSSSKVPPAQDPHLNASAEPADAHEGIVLPFPGLGGSLAPLRALDRGNRLLEKAMALADAAGDDRLVLLDARDTAARATRVLDTTWRSFRGSGRGMMTRLEAIGAELWAKADLFRMALVRRIRATKGRVKSSHLPRISRRVFPARPSNDRRP